MKRFCSVKEASKLLGVSTNTIYKYIDQNKIAYKRIGNGRIKIPTQELMPFIQTAQQAEENNVKENNISVNEINNKEILESKEDGDQEREQKIEVSSKGISQEEEVGSYGEGVDLYSDGIFFRLFKGICLSGLGVVYLLVSKGSTSIDYGLTWDLGLITVGVLPYLVLIAGVLNIAEVLCGNRLIKRHRLIDIFSAAVLAYVCASALTRGEYFRFSIGAALLLSYLGHIMTFTSGEGQLRKFSEAFSRFTLIFIAFFGVIILYFKSDLELKLLGYLTTNYQQFLVSIWIVFLIIPLIYFSTKSGSKSKALHPFFLVLGIVSLYFATEMIIIRQWDIAYCVYLYAVFSVFLSLWPKKDIDLLISRSKLINVAFIWIGFSIVLGIFSAYQSQKQLIKNKYNDTIALATQIGNDLDYAFEKTQALVIGYAGDPQTLALIENRDTEGLVGVAKKIYENTEGLSGVAIYDKDGIALANYPRNSMVMGTNFSSRDYFQKTKETYKSVVTPVFEKITEEVSFVTTEPVFKNNQFAGMISFTPSLTYFSSSLKSKVGNDFDIYVIDSNGVYAFNSNKDKIGIKADVLGSNSSDQNNENLIVRQQLRYNGWDLYISGDYTSVTNKIPTFNILLTFVITLNAVFSITVAIIASSEKVREDSGTYGTTILGNKTQFA